MREVGSNHGKEEESDWNHAKEFGVGVFWEEIEPFINNIAEAVSD